MSLRERNSQYSVPNHVNHLIRTGAETMKRLLWIAVFLSVGSVTFAVEAQVTTEELVKGRGNIVRNGGGGAKPLFISERKQISVTRVAATGGSIKYEITCTDTANTTFQTVCDVISFEPKKE